MSIYFKGDKVGNTVAIGNRPTQTKTATPTTSQQLIKPDSGYELSSVTVNAVTSSIDANIQSNNIKDGINILGVAGNVVEYNPTRNETVTPSTMQQIVSSSSASQLNSVTVDAVNLEVGNVMPTTSQQTLLPTSPNLGFSQVTVDAVTSSIDANITAENIKNGVNILGVTGNYQGGGNYTRPSDWITIPAMDGTQDEIYILMGVFTHLTNSISFKIAGNLTIDWGDGTTDTNNTNAGNLTTFSHTYNYNDLSNSSWSEYSQSRQALIHIYGTRSKIYNLTFNDFSYTTPYTIYEIRGNCSLTEVVLYNMSNAMRYLEIFDWMGTLTNTSGDNLFTGCSRLQKISDLVFQNNLFSINNMFNGCSMLSKLPKFDTSNVTRASYLFAGCRALYDFSGISFPVISNATGMFYQKDVNNLPNDFIGSTVTNMSQFMSYSNNMLSYATKLPLWDTRNVTNFNSAFYYMLFLKVFPPYNTSNAIDIGNIFGSSSTQQLEKAYSYDIRKVTGGMSSGTFGGCPKLKNLVFFGCNNTYGTSLTHNLTNLIFANSDAWVEFCNGLGTNNSGYTRTYRFSANVINNILNTVYVKDSGSLYSTILPTNDAVYDNTKTYYIYAPYDENDFTVATIMDFDPGIIYFEEVSGTWNRYERCESTDAGAITLYDLLTNIKGYTITT